MPPHLLTLFADKEHLVSWYIGHGPTFSLQILTLPVKYINYVRHQSHLPRASIIDVFQILHLLLIGPRELKQATLSDILMRSLPVKRGEKQHEKFKGFPHK